MLPREGDPRATMRGQAASKALKGPPPEQIEHNPKERRLSHLLFI